MEKLERRETNEDSLALELLKQVKANATKWFIISIIELVIILSIIGAIIYVSYLAPVEDVTKTESYDIDSQDNGNAIYNDSGKVNVNGKDKDSTND